MINEAFVDIEKIEQYEISGILGTGAAGTAYLAKDERGNQVALKLLSDEMSQDEIMQKRFVREMVVLSKLQHQNIVRYLESGLYEGKFFYVMELVDSGTLKEVLMQRGALTWQETVECGMQICAGLQRVHEHGIIHRDLKPGNLFLSSSGLVKMGDFGTVRDLKAESLTIAGQTLGTIHYLAPEQISGKKDISDKVDLYALGCVLVEMLTGRAPYIGETVKDVLDQHFHDPPPDLPSVCPPRLRALVNQLLAKAPDDRPDSAAAVQDQLQEILREHDQPHADDDSRGGLERKNLIQRLRGSTADTPHISRMTVGIAAAVLVCFVSLARLFTQ
ncbi:MAG: serine/threonine protein kinase [Planctomycetales bacterium]